jgi:hypothetical protein
LNLLSRRLTVLPCRYLKYGKELKQKKERVDFFSCKK